MYTGELGCASGWEGEGGEWNDVKREHHLLQGLSCLVCTQ